MKGLSLNGGVTFSRSGFEPQSRTSGHSSRLRELLDSLIDKGDIPPPLQQWAIEVAARRRSRPTRRGPKSDPRGDFRMWVDAILRKELKGMSLRAAYREISAESKHKNLSPEAVESAVRRGKQWPPGAV